MNPQAISLIGGARGPSLRAVLSAEMDRVDGLIQAVMRHRDGKVLGQQQRLQLAELQAQVSRGRSEGIFADLLALCPGQEPDLVLDCLMIVAYELVRPSKARSLQALAGQPAGEFALSQSLVHELLMPDDALEAKLGAILSPSSILIRNGLLRAEGTGPARQLRPGFALARFVSGDEGRLNPPEGVRLIFEPGDTVPQMFLSPRTAQRLDEVEGLVRMLDRHNPGMAGPSALFTGGPGTGKSLAVLHMAHRLKRPLYQIDLGRVVSKWIGETERNLSRIFGEMSGTEGCILIDEADALLGKRIEVKESRDQHANVTVSHLLSLLERHQGPVFLTTNLRSNLDPAYIRRFASVVDFHRPDLALRRLIWNDALARALPEVSRQQRASLVALAAEADMSAAEILNAAVVSAALSMQHGDGIGPADLARAIMLEKTKGGMTFSRDDLGPLAPHLQSGDPS